MSDETNSPSDEAANDEAANDVGVETLFEEHRGKLLAFIDRQLGAKLRSKLEPDDVLQEVLTEVVRVSANSTLDRSHAFSWLCQVAERKIIDLHRHYFQAQKRDAGREVSLQGGGSSGGGDSSRPAGLVQMLAVSMTSPSAAYSRQAREHQLADAVDKLQPEMREAIHLRYVENMPSKDIAERLGKSDAAIRVMLSRAVKKLQDILGDDSNFVPPYRE